MVRIFLAATAISFLAGVIPASAQGLGKCAEWCRMNRCSAGMANRGNPVKCMKLCTEKCEQKKGKG